MTHLEEALQEIVTALQDASLPYMLIGGLAVSAWGEPRSTLDVDITVWATPESLGHAVAALAARVRALPQDPLRFVRDTRVLPLESRGGVRIDVVFAALPVQQEAIGRARSKEIGGVSTRVASVEDLILMKLISEREKDLEDARRLLRRFRETLDRSYLGPRLAELAEGLARPGILSIYQSEIGASGRHG